MARNVKTEAKTSTSLATIGHNNPPGAVSDAQEKQAIDFAKRAMVDNREGDKRKNSAHQYMIAAILIEVDYMHALDNEYPTLTNLEDPRNSKIKSRILADLKKKFLPVVTPEFINSHKTDEVNNAKNDVDDQAQLIVRSLNYAIVFHRVGMTVEQFRDGYWHVLVAQLCMKEPKQRIGEYTPKTPVPLDNKTWRVYSPPANNKADWIAVPVQASLARFIACNKPAAKRTPGEKPPMMVDLNDTTALVNHLVKADHVDQYLIAAFRLLAKDNMKPSDWTFESLSPDAQKALAHIAMVFQACQENASKNVQRKAA